MCFTDWRVPLEASARLAQHSLDEAKRYSTNSSYELSDVTAAALKLVSTHTVAHLAHTASLLAPM